MFSLEQWNLKTWENWAGNYRVSNCEKVAPRSLSSVQEIVKNALEQKKCIRVTGAGHSFSGCAVPDQIALTLHYMRGIVEVDEENFEVTLWGGTYLYEIGPLLLPYNMALENMGDIQYQTIAGSIATGTHGTGITLGSLSSQIVWWEWIDGKGEIHRHRRGDDDLSLAMHISMGMLGIVTRVRVKTIPLYGLREVNISMPFDEALSSFRKTTQEFRHMEWFLFPGTSVVQQKTLSVIAPKPMSRTQKIKDEFESRVILNGIFALLSKGARKYPQLVRPVSKISANSIPDVVREGYSYEVFPKPRGVSFVETEYFVPYRYLEDCLTKVHEAFLEDNRGSHFPIEVRTHKGEAGFLSATQGQDCMVLSFHVYQGMPYQALFEWLGDFMKPWQGRPHWGKVNVYSASYLKELYPELETFLQLRQEFDPEGLFVSKWFKEKFDL